MIQNFQQLPLAKYMYTQQLSIASDHDLFVCNRFSEYKLWQVSQKIRSHNYPNCFITAFSQCVAYKMMQDLLNVLALYTQCLVSSIANILLLTIDSKFNNSNIFSSAMFFMPEAMLNCLYTANKIIVIKS